MHTHQLFICGCLILTRLASAATSIQVPSVPLDEEEADAYISQFAAGKAAYYRNEADFADIFEGIWDKSVFTVNADGKSMNFH
eukprot:CAMPEP_0202712078 /NCGR_PEP_ID=MMETSP1385-20130828/32896_1 /ASSEMBLY_ACC=CAM_ASM_000861 /TAXON_ID=933848 /ORGANISM="Elphidium margaritaceum" /LENGTH=82 /DNA_ID=CAMNT_0049371997 /DNA_START=73 /DNA_END=318 /DNA_ORIENTATION=+